MTRSRNLPGRSSLGPKDATKDQSQVGRLKEGKRKRKTLGERTNMSVRDLLQPNKKRKQVMSGEDKENIPPQEANARPFTIPKPKPVPTINGDKGETQPIFSCDIFRCKKDGHLFVLEYVRSVTRALVNNEQKSADLLPNPNYFLKQTNIRPRMRTILFSWMTEVHLQFELKEVVLWASFQICDRFLSKVNTHREKLQLVGCTSIWIASKYHEIYPPLASDLVHMSDSAFTRSDIIAMEVRICETLGYKFSIPNAFQFLDRFTEVAINSIKETRLKNRVKWLARYAMERFHMQVKALQYCPSLLAAGALFAALKLTSNRWTSSCERVSGYSERKLLPELTTEGELTIFQQIKETVMDFDSTNHKAIITKYKKAERGSVSTLRKKEKSVPKIKAREIFQKKLLGKNYTNL